MTEEEFRYGLIKIGVPGVTAKDVGLLFRTIDKDQGGTVSYQELRDGLREKSNLVGLRYEGFQHSVETLGLLHLLGKNIIIAYFVLDIIYILLNVFLTYEYLFF